MAYEGQTNFSGLHFLVEFHLLAHQSTCPYKQVEVKSTVDKRGACTWNLSWSNSHKVLVWRMLPAKAGEGSKYNVHLLAVLQIQSHSVAEPIMKEGEKKRPHDSKGNWCRGILLSPQWRSSFTSLVAELPCCWKVQFQSLPSHVFSPSLCVGAVMLCQHRQLQQLADPAENIPFLWLFLPAGSSELLWVTARPHKRQYYHKGVNGDTHQGKKENHSLCKSIFPSWQKIVVKPHSWIWTQRR